MRKAISIIMVVLLTVIGAYLLWSALGRTAVAAETDIFLDDTSSFGADIGNGNLVGVQTYMQASDYASADAFYSKLDSYMAEAEAKGWLRPNTIVVFPESIGSWLVVVGEKAEIYESSKVEDALQLMVLSNLPRFLTAYSASTGNNRISDSVFRMKSDSMATIYQETFARLAEEYGVTIVAGSIYLPEPQIWDGEIVLGAGAIENVTAVFRTDGSLYPHIVRKINVTSAEAPFASSGPIDQIMTFETSAGRVAVLICADSWYLEPYATLAKQEPDMIVVPNNYFTEGGWDALWQGYDPGPAPADVDSADIGRITEGEARLKYTLDGRMQETGATTGMHVFSSGVLWDMIMDGHTIIFTEDGVIEASPEARGALVNYWLPENE